jgi:hypothetical protein
MAEYLSVPSGALTVGSTITVGYGPNSGLANQTVMVHITDNSEPPNEETLNIQLDGQGSGSAQWHVADWDVVHFNAPDATEVTRHVVLPVH